MLISADLAHTHDQNGPYGFYKDAERVDQLFEDWMVSLEKFPVSSENVESIKNSLCCGYTGFRLLYGILATTNSTSRILSRRTPTYYGMMVAYFYPKTKTRN